MKHIFESGEFSRYRVTSLNESRGLIRHSELYSSITTVFLSHKHDDLEDLKDLIGFFQSRYGVKVYIDSRDSSMPKVTSGTTANKLKNRIKQCDKFVLLATNSAIESKWCNWELGYGDAQKFKDNIAIFPIKPKGSYDNEYKGNEYFEIYPYIVYCYGTERYINGGNVERGYYVCSKENNGEELIEPLDKWLNNK